MSYINFDKTKLINLKYSLSKEFIRSNRAGAFAGSTIINCNTRKYHGLLNCPIDEIDGQSHVLLSALDETIIQHGKEFHLAVRKYPGIFHPGHKYLRDFSTEPIPTLTYRVGGVIFQKEMLFAEKESQVLLKYTLIEAHSPTTLLLHPFMAFRNIHAVNKASLNVNTKYFEAKNGIKMRMYEQYPYLYLQTSKKVDYIHAPDWFYNVEYSEEEQRGYEFTEDLFVPGYFEFPLKKGESIVFSAGLKEAEPSSLKRKFASETNKRIPRDSFENCLKNSAEQFIFKKKDKTEVIAGFPWFGTIARDTFISTPGLTLAVGDKKTAKEILDTAGKHLKKGLFNNNLSDTSDNNSVDSPLWYIWALQQFSDATNIKTVWKDYGSKIKSILDNYKKGTDHNISMNKNGLIYAGKKGLALTWMNAVIEGNPVTPRTGYDVEVNALWYNSIQFALEAAKKSGDDKFVSKWEKYPEQIKESFIDLFWDDDKKYLADFVNEDGANWEVRPNQVFAASLPYSMLSLDQCKMVMDVVQGELLTPKGLRTLSPQSTNYIGTYIGNEHQRDAAYHQGTAWPWLICHFCEAILKVHKNSALQMIKDVYEGFGAEMTKAGIGTISEIFDGDPPHKPKGAISQAKSVAELLRLKTIIDNFEKANS